MRRPGEGRDGWRVRSRYSARVGLGAVTSSDLSCTIASVRDFSAAACGVDQADRFDVPGAGVGRDGVCGGQGDVRRGVRVDLVGLPPHPPDLPGRADYLEDLDACITEMAGQARAVRVRALDPGSHEHAVTGDEPLQRLVAGLGGGELRGGEVLAGDADHCGIVGVLVRVDARDDGPALVGHRVLPFVGVSQWEASAGHGRQDVDEIPVQGSRSYEVMPGRPTLRHRPRADRSKRRQTPERGRQSSCGSCPRRLFPVSTSSCLCKRSRSW